MSSTKDFNPDQFLGAINKQTMFESHKVLGRAQGTVMRDNLRKWPVDKKKVVRIKNILRKMKLGKYLPNQKKYTRFYRIFTEGTNVLEFAQAHGEITPHLMKDMKKTFVYWMNQPAIDFGRLNRSPMTISELNAIFFPFKAAIVSLPKESDMFKVLDSVGDLLINSHCTVLLAMHGMLTRIVLSHSNLMGIGLVTYDYEIGNHSRDGEWLRERILFGIYTPKTISVQSRGEKRKGYEVVFESKFQYGFVEMTALFKGEQRKCYIQSHAYKRIEERLDFVEPWVARELCFESAHEQPAFRYEGNILLPVTLEKKKVGYFLCEFHKDILLLKTFLLVTHNGTPEGDVFSQKLQLEKQDIALLQLDRLSCFKRESLREDKLIQHCFGESEISYLFDLKLSKNLLPDYLTNVSSNNPQGHNMIVLGRR